MYFGGVSCVMVLLVGSGGYSWDVNQTFQSEKDKKKRVAVEQFFSCIYIDIYGVVSGGLIVVSKLIIWFL